ncbi:MAG: PH domain-containing protein [Candidatus Peribacteraceae bacterium]|jgi:hypothetical protein
MLDNFLFKKHLEDDETVSLIVHKYWGVASQSMFWPSLALVAGLTFLALAPVKTVLYIVLPWSAFSLVWLLRNFLDYYLDVWIITDQGIIALKWEGWFHRTSNRILFSDIQGVGYEIKGLMGTLNRCGTLNIEKVSTGGAVSIANVRQPKKIEALILRNMEAYLHDKNLKNAKHVQDLLAEFVAEKIQLQDVSTKAQEEKKAKGVIVTRRV